MKTVTGIVIGGGQRGMMFANFGLDHPERFKVVGVAEPIQYNREKLQREHKIPDDKVFKTWEDVAKVDKFADCVLITTQDQMHKDPAVVFAKKGYHILLEKPMAVTYKDCKEIVAASKENDVILATCHVLRYAAHARKIKELIDSGVIGDIVNIQLLEPVGFWHFAHSYVRGNWRNQRLSSFSLLAKSCHDIDLIQMWMHKTKCTAVSSFGSLKHFTKQNQPEGAASRCVDCSVEDKCPYSAKKIYMGGTDFPTSIITNAVDIESVTEALRTGPYGRCVYDCDNDVMDNQVVNMQFEDGATATFTMMAFSEKVCVRQARVFGTKGELTADFGTNYVKHFDFLSNTGTKHDLTSETRKSQGTRLGGHGGADFFAMDAFVEAVATNDPSKVLTNPDACLESHFLTFAAEKARVENRVINLSMEHDVC